MGFMDLINKAGKRSSSEIEEEHIEEATAEEEHNEQEEAYDVDSVYAEDDTEEAESDEIYASDDVYESSEDVYKSTDTQDDSIYEQISNSEENEEDYTVEAHGIKEKLGSTAKSGCNIVVTGCCGCGNSTVAYNLAVVLAKLGFKTLIVDFDTIDRALSYVGADSYEALGLESMSLESAINQGVRLGSAIRGVRKGLYAIGLGAAVDAYSFEETVKVENIAKFMSDAKNQFEFVVYDIPLYTSIGKCTTAVSICDRLLLTSGANTSDMMKTVTALTNIEDDTLLRMMFTKSTPVFTKMKQGGLILGRKTASEKDIVKQADAIIQWLAGEDIGVHFSDMNRAVSIKYDDKYDECWYKKPAVSCSKEISNDFLNLISRAI